VTSPGYAGYVHRWRRHLLADEEVQRATEVLRAIGRRVADDPRFRAELESDPLEVMRAAGLGIVNLLRVARVHGVSDEDLDRLGIAFEDIDDPQEYKLTNWCIGTCKKQTLWACVGGCSKSFTSKPPSGSGTS